MAVFRPNFVQSQELPDDPGIEGQTGPTQEFTAEGASVKLYPGTGLPPDQVELQNTKVPAPGVPIPKPAGAVDSGGGPGYEAGSGGRPGGMSPRRAFEQSVFDHIGGNPFEIDVMREVDKATKQDMPALFNRVFGGRLIWEDRRRMDKKQADFWDNEVKRYRAYLKEMIDSDRRTKIDVYNQMTRTFDNDEKEREARERRIQSVNKKFMDQRVKDEEKRIKTVDQAKKDMRQAEKDEADALKQIATITKEGGDLSPDAQRALAAQEQILQSARATRHAIRMQFDKNYKEKFEADEKARRGDTEQNRVETSRPMPSDKPKEADGKKTAKVSGFNVVVGPKGVPIAVKRHRGTGKLVAQYAEGQPAEFIEEAKE